MTANEDVVVDPVQWVAMSAIALVPEVKANRSARANLIHFSALVAGVLLLWVVQAALEG
jgi:hypothetical protein